MNSRSIDLTMLMTKDEAGRMAEWTQPSPGRTITITLRAGEVWPRTMRRGQVVALTMDGYRITGRVIYRRLDRMVIDGEARLI